MALLESTIGKGLVAVAVGAGGYTVLESSGVISQGNKDKENKKQRNVKVGGIPQRTVRGSSRGRGVPQTVTRKNITKKNVTIEEGDTNITRVTKVKNTSGTKKNDSGGGSSSDFDGFPDVSVSDDGVIKDEESGGVIRDASPNNSGTKKEDSGSDSGSGEKSDDETKKDDSGGSAPPVYSV